MISHLGRKTVDIVSTIEELKDQGVEVILLKENLDTSTPTGQAMFQMMDVMVQLERVLTVQQVHEALASIKARGVKIGRPIMDKQKVKDIIRITGISQGSLYRKIKERDSKQILTKIIETTDPK